MASSIDYRLSLMKAAITQIMLIYIALAWHSSALLAVTEVTNRDVTGFSPLQKTLSLTKKERFTQHHNGFIRLGKNNHSSLSMTAERPSGLFDLVGDGPTLKLTKINDRRMLNGVGQLVDRSEYRIDYKGDPVCDMRVRTTRTLDGREFYAGRLPKIESLNLADTNGGEINWPDNQRATKLIEDYLVVDGFEAKFKMLDSQRCYLFNGMNFIPVMKVEIEKSGLEYLFYIEKEQVLYAENLFFHVASEIHTFENNPLDDIITFKPKVTDSDGYLTNDYITTNNRNSAARAKEAEFVYDYYTEEFLEDPYFDPKFSEATAFAHLNRMVDWYKGNGYVWATEAPLEIYLHESFGGNPNNALYKPSDSSAGGRPTISIGDGDGRVLQNLPFDSDVVAHEFGHHVVFGSITSTSGESLVLHEGLADYFTFAATGNACLGESICPEASGLCEVQGQCLRSAENEMSLLDSSFSRLGPHIKSQVISGLLWDLYLELGEDIATKIAFTTLEYLEPSSGYESLIISVLNADAELHEGANACLIDELARARGFEEYLEGIDCAKFVQPTTSPKTTEEDQDDDKNNLCGVVGKSSDTNAARQFLYLLIFFLVPIIPCIMNRNSDRIYS